jgi:hypothetical protein
LLKIVVGCAGVFSYFAAPDDTAIPEFLCERGDPFGVFAARFSQAMVEMCDADGGVELVLFFQIVDSEQQGG